MYAIQAENGKYLSSLFDDDLKKVFAAEKPIHIKHHQDEKGALGYDTKEDAVRSAEWFENTYVGLVFKVVEMEG